jgi:hypothetical protein
MMHKNKINFCDRPAILVMLFVCLIILSCRKDTAVASLAGNQNLFDAEFFNSTADDFTILVSTSKANENNLAATVIQAYFKENKDFGLLEVNNTSIPYTSSNTYFRQTDYAITSDRFVGTTVKSRFTSTTPQFTSFEINQVTSKLIKLDFEGLTENKIILSNGFNISWSIDSSNIGRKDIILLQGLDNNSTTIVTDKILIQEEALSVNISPEILAKFTTSNTIKIFFVRGKEIETMIDAKRISFKELNFTWAKLLIK